MNVPDTQIKTYMDMMALEFEHINTGSRTAVLVGMINYANGIIRTANFCLGREMSLNIDNFQAQKPKNSSSIQAQNTEINDLNEIKCSNESCDNSIEAMRKGTKYCSKKCKNKARK